MTLISVTEAGNLPAIQSVTAQILLVVLYVLGTGVAIAVNWLLWFRLLPFAFRAMRQSWKR